MASDGPDDRTRRGGGEPSAGPTAGSSAAFAATVAPEPSALPEPALPSGPARRSGRAGPSAPPVLPVGTAAGLPTKILGSAPLDSQPTLDAATLGEAPLLPVVSASHYRAERE